MRPPHPQQLTAQILGANIFLTWQAAQPPDLAHNYGDEPLYFQVFRKQANELEWQLIGESSAPQFTDTDVLSGSMYIYSVVAVHSNLSAGETYSARSEEVSIVFDQ